MDWEKINTLTDEEMPTFPLKMAWWKGFHAYKRLDDCPYKNPVLAEAWSHGNCWAEIEEIYNTYVSDITVR